MAHCSGHSLLPLIHPYNVHHIDAEPSEEGIEGKEEDVVMLISIIICLLFYHSKLVEYRNKSKK